MSTLATALNVSIRGSYQSSGDFSTPTSEIVQNIVAALTTGTGLNQADKIYAKTRSLGATTSEALDFAGSLTDDFGTTITLARIKLLLIVLNTTTAGYTLEVGGNGSNPLLTFFADSTDKLIVRAGGFALLYAPDATAYVVTAATGDLLKINNPNAATISYSIIAIGASA